MDNNMNKNMINTMNKNNMFEEEKIMEELPILKMTPSPYTFRDGTMFWKYWCNDCGAKLSSYMSVCKCKKVEKVEKVEVKEEIKYPIIIDFDNFYEEVDIPPIEPPKLEIGISSYITTDGESKWRYPCGVCDKGLPNAFSFCCCSKCGKKTPAYNIPCVSCDM
jgi:hypothetical protein